MQLFRWSRAFEIYVPEIDAEHRALFQTADALYRAAIKGAALSQLDPLLRELVLHLADHFEHEERLMRHAEYPSYAWHKQQHDGVTAKVVRFKKRILRGDRDAVLVLLQFLSGWLRDHTTLTDRMMGAHIRNYERSHEACAS